MKRLKMLLTLLTAATLCTSTPLEAARRTGTGGYGYQECRRSPYLGPALALGTIALVAIIAIAVQNQSGHAH